MSLDRVKERIRALLNITKDNAATDGEIENAIAAARNLMHAHNLEESEIPKEQRQKKEMGTTNVLTMHGRKTDWESNLAKFCKEFIGHIGYYLDNKKVRKFENGKIGQARSFVFYGETEGCQLAKELFEELHNTIITMSYLQYGNPSWGESYSYCNGFVAGLQEKLKKADDIASNNSTGRALVVQSKQLMLVKQQEAQKWLAQTKGIKLRTLGRKYTTRQHHHSAYERGVEDGKSQSISNERTKKIT